MNIAQQQQAALGGDFPRTRKDVELHELLDRDDFFGEPKSKGKLWKVRGVFGWDREALGLYVQLSIACEHGFISHHTIIERKAVVDINEARQWLETRSPQIMAIIEARLDAAMRGEYPASPPETL